LRILLLLEDIVLKNGIYKSMWSASTTTRSGQLSEWSPCNLKLLIFGHPRMTRVATTAFYGVRELVTGV
jgi:hypothetical protein